MHNRVITAIGNNSASNDHNQHKHDMNSKLIEAAGKFASGKNLGKKGGASFNPKLRKAVADGKIKGKFADAVMRGSKK